MNAVEEIKCFHVVFTTKNSPLALTSGSSFLVKQKFSYLEKRGIIIFNYAILIFLT